MKRSSQNPEAKATAKRSSGELSGGDRQAHAAANPPVSPRRKWAFRVAVFILVPLTLLGGVELVLRLAGYGYSTSFFKPQTIAREAFLVENDKFGLRFFPPELARSPSPVVMRKQKAPGTCRIFILGESAALGDPRPAFGAGRYLQALLQERFPKRKFEMVCVAMTAINSHAIREIARECAGHEGDLWILYLGNNEMIGPFGATGVIGSQAPPLAVVRLNLALQRTRLGQLMVNAGRKLSRKKNQATWGGMEMWVKNHVPPGDPRKEVVYRAFKSNLEAVLNLSGIGSRSGTGPKVILSTMAVNLKDCPPLASVSATNLAAAEQSQFTRLQREAADAMARTNFPDAARLLAEAGRLNPSSAEIEFYLGRCALAAGETHSAAAHFAQARDLDSLPFRADTRLNREIDLAAQNHRSSGLAFFNAENVLAANSKGSIPGEELFYEHVHLNFDGNYRLARAWAERAETLLPRDLIGPTAGDWPSQALCEERLALTDWNRASVIEDLLFRFAQPPLSTQAENDKRVEVWRSRLRALRQTMTKGAAVRARQVYEAAVARSPRDHRLHENFAEFLENVGELEQAANEWRQVSALLPHHHLSYFQRGRLLARLGQLIVAEPTMREAVRLRPDLEEGWLELGRIAMASGKTEQGIEHLQRARQLQPYDPRACSLLGKAFSSMDRRSEAIQWFTQAVQLNPASWEALYSLGEELAFDGKESQARKRFEEVLKLKPDHAMAHLNLGVCMFKAGELQAAATQFQETLRTDPNNKLARQYLDQLSRLR